MFAACPYSTVSRSGILTVRPLIVTSNSFKLVVEYCLVCGCIGLQWFHPLSAGFHILTPSMSCLYISPCSDCSGSADFTVGEGSGMHCRSPGLLLL